MTGSARTIAKVTAVALLGVGAVALAVSRLHSSLAGGEEGLQAWFYDESEQRLYLAAKDAIAPDPGIGGPAGDGARAIVVAGPGECGDPAKRRIAYLEKYTPQFKLLLEDVRAARAEGRPPARPMPPSESDYYDRNTLVRRPADATWYDLTTAEAKRIVAEWREWRGPDGAPLNICTP